MRRLFSCLLLALLVIGAQQSALVHEIGHGLGRASTTPFVLARGGDATRPGSADAGSYCEKCFQFAHVTGALTGHCPGLDGSGATAESAPFDGTAAISADAPQSRSRGPPIVL